MKNLVFGLIFILAIPAVAQTYIPAKAARERVKAAEQSLVRRDVERAVHYYLEAALADPNWAAPHRGLAELYTQTKKYSGAAEEYEKARQCDDTHPQLTPEERHSVRDGQIISLGLAWELNRSIAAAREAIAEDPDYPLYHYNLACGLAEKDDLDGAIAELQKAWATRANLPRGQRFPDIHEDPSFDSYIGDPKFEDAVRNMVD